MQHITCFLNLISRHFSSAVTWTSNTGPLVAPLIASDDEYARAEQILHTDVESGVFSSALFAGCADRGTRVGRRPVQRQGAAVSARSDGGHPVQSEVHLAVVAVHSAVRLFRVAGSCSRLALLGRTISVRCRRCITLIPFDAEHLFLMTTVAVGVYGGGKWGRI